MKMDADGAREAWARLAGLPALGGVQVVVDPASWLAPRGWIGILALDGTITASVPRPDLADAVHEALRGVSHDQATVAEVVVPRLPPTGGVLGPASLFFPPAGYDLGAVDPGRDVSGSEVATLLAPLAPEDLEESGIAEVTGTLCGSRSQDGVLVAVCGYRRWPNGVAHLSVLTHPDHRRAGHGRRVAAAAVRRGIEDRLLPQWRARRAASKALARSIGLIEVGAQLAVEPR